MKASQSRLRTRRSASANGCSSTSGGAGVSLSKLKPSPSWPTATMPPASGRKCGRRHALRARASRASAAGCSGLCAKACSISVSSSSWCCCSCCSPSSIKRSGLAGAVAGQQFRHRGIDMRAVAADVVGGRAGDHAAGEARLPGADCLVIGVEQEAECLVEGAVARQMRGEHELLEEPGGVRAVPFGRAGIGHRLDALVFRREACGEAFGVVAHGAEGCEPGPRGQAAGHVVHRAARPCFAAGSLRPIRRLPLRTGSGGYGSG